MISFQSSGICSVNNPRNVFQFPRINSFIQKRGFLKRDIWYKQNVGYCEFGIVKKKSISYLFTAYLRELFAAYKTDISSKVISKSLGINSTFSVPYAYIAPKIPYL